jgi:peptide/histidine transporter 3/4
VKPCLEAFGADQFDEDDPVENKMKSSFFNWWYFGLCMGALLAFTVIIYVEDNASYGTGYGILTVFIILACGLFLGGTPLYRKIKLSDDHSPLLSVFQVFVAAARKWSLPVPENEKMLYECTYDEKKAALTGKRQLVHTKGLRYVLYIVLSMVKKLYSFFFNVCQQRMLRIGPLTMNNAQSVQ